MLTFSPVQITSREIYYPFWQETPCHSLDYTLANLWGWQRYFGLEWAVTKELLWVRQKSPSPVYWAPLGRWNTIDWQKTFSCLPSPISLIRVPEPLVLLLKEQLTTNLEVFEDRGQWEYLYLQSDLATLAGKNFHKKKNHLSQFIREYGPPDYRSVNEDMVEDVLKLQDEWCQWHECESSSSLRSENEAINQVLSHWECFTNMCGGAIYVDGKIVAFSIGEKLDAENLGVHFEKGLNGYKGIYQTINQVFASQVPTRFINRAQDLDEEGLRQAKESYHPVDFLRKYRCRITLN